MFEWLNGIDESLFHSLNGTLTFADTFMWYVSQPLAWTPLYILMIVGVLRKYKSSPSRLFIILGVVVCVGMTDLISARIMKPQVERLRPSHREDFNESIHLYKKSDGEFYKGGKYSFVSSHASNHMGIAVLMGALLCGGLVWGWWMIALIIWALLIGYSRIHLGVHFPGDVLCGSVLGAGIGLMVYWVLNKRLALQTFSAS
jgi:undecaprenyl-diphosphatase